MQVDPIKIDGRLKEFLTLNCLPVLDLKHGCGSHFFGIHIRGNLIACIGLEVFNSCSLLRSLAVEGAWRNRGLGRALVNHIETFSGRSGLFQIFLLTTTAEPYFLALGYHRILRSEFPDVIRGSTQSQYVCPDEATAMTKSLS